VIARQLMEDDKDDIDPGCTTILLVGNECFSESNPLCFFLRIFHQKRDNLLTNAVVTICQIDLMERFDGFFTLPNEN